MAEVTAAARAARADASRLRSETLGLKLSVRGNLARSRERLEQAQEATDLARARRGIPCASPWSGLDWLLEDESLDRILLPID